MAHFTEEKGTCALNEMQGRWRTHGTKASSRRGGSTRNYGQQRTPLSVSPEHAGVTFKRAFLCQVTKITDKRFTFPISREIH
jgi:hypothetical protein